MSGHIFKTKCEPILSEIAIQVQQQIINELQLATPNIIAIPIGSVGKRPYDQYNGDIDIAIKCNTIEELESIIRNTFYYLDVITIESLYIVSIAFPYKTLESSKKSSAASKTLTLSPLAIRSRRVFFRRVDFPEPLTPTIIPS